MGFGVFVVEGKGYGVVETGVVVFLFFLFEFFLRLFFLLRPLRGFLGRVGEGAGMYLFTVSKPF